MAKSALERLLALSGAVQEDYDPYKYVIRTPSPSTNFTFGPPGGVAEGFTVIGFGPPEGGKSLTGSLMIGQLHQDDPTAVAVKWNTEFRESLQMTPHAFKICKIDRKRYIPWETNSPEDIFDRFEKDIPAAINSGVNIKLAVIDSINGILGRRGEKNASINDMTIGDLALTLQDGFKRILAVQRKYRIVVYLTAHVRAEMNMLEQRRGNLVKMAAAFGVKHEAEYFWFIERDETVEGRADHFKQPFIHKALRDANPNSKGEIFAHKIRITMKKSSGGFPRGRVGVFTWDYRRGVINVDQEVFGLARARNVIKALPGAYYTFGEHKWKGERAVIEALGASPELQAAVLADLKARDTANNWDVGAEAEAPAETEDGDLASKFGTGETPED
jgi:hypothetical protein